MGSPNTEAFAELLDAQEESAGSRITAKIGEVTADTIPSTYIADLMQVNGGSGFQGGYSLQMLVSDFPERPVKGASVTVSCYPDQSLELVADPEESHGIYTLRVGDFSTE